MAYVIESNCTNCGDCEAACPVDAIIQTGKQRVINVQHCIDCGACVEACPENAIAEV